MERHRRLVTGALLSETPVRLEIPGVTLDGQDLDLLHVGNSSASALQCWILARQHPGETMAEWWMEGFIERLLDSTDQASCELLRRATFHIVPNMNPDGSRRGHMRTNAIGVNLNSQWLSPSIERSPEVFLIRKAMIETDVDFCLDVHGDEAIPYCFLVDAGGIPSITDKQKTLQSRYADSLVGASPDFQTTHGYPPDEPGTSKLTVCSNYVAETFGCLSMTLEMPFKDNQAAPNALTGWSPERSRRLGRANIDALNAVLDRR
jgi:murein tripeptide amidase MpaA